MRHDVMIAARAAGCALGALVLYACSTAAPSGQTGATSPAPAVTGQNSSATAPATPSENPPPPQTDVTEQKTGPK
ncbi:hypothetical protein [Phenylobacterium sp.]|jgi:hypothetical protein|uniref:hypothetical protein n=1 Tax=Phenylobacterium sp. TaxID=1871053 RepID=UPI002F3F501B